MKKALTPALIVLFALFAILPIFYIIAFFAKSGFSLYHEKLYAIFITVFAIAETVALLVTRIRLSKTGRVFAILILPFSVLNAIAFMQFDWKFAVILGIICFVCALLIFIKCSDDCNGKAASAVISIFLGLAALAVFVITVITVWKTDFVIEKTFPSPDGELVAEVGIKSTLISEKTVITVRPSGGIKNALIGKYYIKPYEIYSGDETDIYTAKMDWIDEKTFVINGVDHYLGRRGPIEKPYTEEESSEDASE